MFWDVSEWLWGLSGRGGGKSCHQSDFIHLVLEERGNGGEGGTEKTRLAMMESSKRTGESIHEHEALL